MHCLAMEGVFDEIRHRLLETSWESLGHICYGIINKCKDDFPQVSESVKSLFSIRWRTMLKVRACALGKSARAKG